MSSILHCTREDIKNALDFNESAVLNGRIDDAIESATEVVEGHLHRKFYPLVGTMYFDWPAPYRSRSYRLWIDQEQQLVSVPTSLVSGGTAISSSDVFVEPINSGPPYDRVEIDLSSNSSFNTGNTHQRNVAITSTWGYREDSISLGTIAEDLTISETDVDISDSSKVGVGDIVKVDSERMIVTERQMLDTTQDIQSAMNALASDDIVDVTNGATFFKREIIQIGSEKMLILEIAGNNLTVKRGYDGSTLAAHAQNDSVYALRTLIVERGALGTTAATHSSNAAISKHKYPPLIKKYTMAEAINELKQDESAWARVAGEGENANEFIGRGLDRIRKQARARHGRKARLL